MAANNPENVNAQTIQGPDPTGNQGYPVAVVGAPGGDPINVFITNMPDLSDAVILHPDSLNRNRVQATGDFHELELRAQGGQTVPIFQLENSAGTVMLDAPPDGTIAPGSGAILRFYRSSDGLRMGEIFDGGQGAGPGMGIESSSYMELDVPSGFDVFLNGGLIIQGNHVAVVGCEVWAAGAIGTQVGNLALWSGPGRSPIYTRINKDGYFMTRKVSAPADGDLVNSEVAIWLDDTPGSTSINFKAKDSAGTVRTGSVALT